MTALSLVPDDDRQYARSTDPETSRAAASANPNFRKGQKWDLLKAHVLAFVDCPDVYVRQGMHADEAWLAAGGTVPSTSCYWHRHGDLDNHFGLLERVRYPSGKVVKRRGESGQDREVFKLTIEGWDYYWNVATSD